MPTTTKKNAGPKAPTKRVARPKPDKAGTPAPEPNAQPAGAGDPATGETEKPQTESFADTLNGAVDAVNALEEPGEIKPFKRSLTPEERQHKYAQRRGGAVPRGSSKPKQ